MCAWAEWADAESARGTNLKTDALKNFNEEFDKCQKAINDKNVDDMLALFPGKEMLPALANFVGFSVDTMLVSATTNIVAANYPHLVKIIKSVGDKLV